MTPQRVFLFIHNLFSYKWYTKEKSTMQNKIKFPDEPSDEIQTRIDAFILRQHELKISKEDIAKRVFSSYGYAYTPKDVASRLSLYQ